MNFIRIIKLKKKYANVLNKLKYEKNFDNSFIHYEDFIVNKVKFNTINIVFIVQDKCIKITFLDSNDFLYFINICDWYIFEDNIFNNNKCEYYEINYKKWYPKNDKIEDLAVENLYIYKKIKIYGSKEFLSNFAFWYTIKKDEKNINIDLIKNTKN